MGIGLNFKKIDFDLIHIQIHVFYNFKRSVIILFMLKLLNNKIKKYLSY